MVALYEYFHMVKELGRRAFTLTGMLCGAIYMIGELFLSAHALDRSIPTISRWRFSSAFSSSSFSRQMFRAAASRDSLEAIAYTGVRPALYSVALQLSHQDHLPDASRRKMGRPTGQFYLIYLMVVTKFSDMGAYVFGSLFGRHPFAPHISPKKTWEGFFGALLLSSLGQLLALRADSRAGFRALRLDDVVILGLPAWQRRGRGRSCRSRSSNAARTRRIRAAILPGIGGTPRSDRQPALHRTADVFLSQAGHRRVSENPPRRHPWSHRVDREKCPKGGA